MITGESEFNEVFFTDAALPEGERGRRGQQRLGRRHDAARLRAGRGGRHVPDEVPRRARPAACALARERGRDRRSRHPPAPGVVLHEGRDHALPRHAHAHPVPRRPAPGPDASIFKLYWSEYHKRRHRAGASTSSAPTRWSPSGVAGQRVPDRRPRRAERRARGCSTFLNARAGTIYAGTSQVQRNILGEMVLGLPKEPQRRHWRPGPSCKRTACGRAAVRSPPSAPVVDRAAPMGRG